MTTCMEEADNHFVEELEERENTVPFLLTTMALGEETDGGVFSILKGL